VKRGFFAGLLTAYVLTAVLFASAAPNMPALNWKGRTYYGVVWPAWPLSAALNRLVVPIPSWCFTFEEPHP
jgi:hypothetical protein